MGATFWRWRTDVWSLCWLGVMWGTVYAVWPYLPEEVPLHWGADGAVTRYGPRSSVWLLPAIALLQWVAVKLLGKRGGMRADVVAAWVSATLGLTFLGVVGAYLDYWSPASLAVDEGSGLPGGVLCLILGAMSWLAQGMEQNTVIGLRTRWTLGSRVSWVRSHRLAGQSAPVAAAALVLPELLGVALPGPVVLALLLAWASFLWWYSYVQWRDDPERGRGEASHEPRSHG